MPDLTSIYNYYYMFPGDKWYSGFDEENMQIADNQFAQMAKFVGPCVGTGWTVTKLSSERNDQLLLLSNYLNNPLSEYGQKLSSLNLNFSSSNICAAGTTNNITLSGGAPNILDNINLSLNDKILVKDQTNKSENGVYKVSSLGSGLNGTWIRDEILDTSEDFNDNFLVYVSGGLANTSSLWIGASLGMTFGSNDLYFVNAFNQCAKVYPGDGIIDLFYGKTEKPYYFRFINSDDHYIWAEKTLNIEYNNSCKIVAPEEPNLNYGDINKSTYLSTIVSSLGSTLYDLPTIDSIIYGPKRRQFVDATSEIQSLLKSNFSNHKHLGLINSADKINLSTHLVLNAVNSYENVTKLSSTVFILQNQDGTIFEESLDNYGNPLVYVDNKLLSSTEYKISSDTSPIKLYLKNSVSSKSNVLIYLPSYDQKNLICIDENGDSITGLISSVSSHVYLSDGEKEDSNPDDLNANLTYKKFSWNNTDFLNAKVYVNGNLVKSKHYIVNPYNASIKFLNTLPEYNSSTYNQVVVVIDEIGKEIQNKISYDKLENLNASSINKGTLLSSDIDKFSHYQNSKYKISASYTFDKFLLSGLGNSYFYPENLYSDLQYNTNTFSLFKTLNLDNKNYLTLCNRGLMQSDASFTQIKLLESWNNDDGLPAQLIDDLLIPDNFNKFQTTYLRSSEGKLFYTNDKYVTWNEFNLPYASNSKQVVVNCFDVSTDKIEIDTGVYQYSSFVYIASNDGLYFANPLENQTQYEWDWNRIPIYVNDSIVNLKNINFVKETSQRNSEIIVGSQDIITYDRKIYAGSSDASYPGLYFGDKNYVKRVFSENCKGITWINSGIYQNNIIWWNDYDVYITHTSRFVSNETGEYWEFPFELETSTYSDCVCATTTNISLSGLQTIDGFVLSANDRVLVKNQIDATENGIYTASSGTWSRSSDLNADSEFIYGKYVNITNGTENSGSSWYLKYNSQYEINFTDIEWDIYKKKIYSTNTPSFSAERSVLKNVIVRNSNLNEIQYIAIYDNGISLITDSSSIVVEDLIYEKPYQGKINGALSVQTSDADGSLFLATENSIYKSTVFLWKDKDNVTDIDIEKNPWNRTENSFQISDEIFLLNSKTNLEITNYLKFYQWQLINILDSLDLGTNIVYEKDFRNFYIDPWYYDYLDDNGNSLKYTLTVFIDDKPTKVPYFTDPQKGLIQFIKSISKNHYKNVSVSIFINDQFLENTAVLTHDELFSPSNSNNAIARLSVENLPSEKKLYLNQTIDNDEKIIKIDDGNNYEILYIESVNNYKSPVEVNLIETRSSTNSNYTFPAGSTIYSIKDILTDNLQDAIYNLISKERYNLGSLNNINHNKMISKLDQEILNVFDILPTAPIVQKDTRGFSNIKFTNDFVNDSILDASNSILTKNSGVPDLFAFENNEVSVIYDIDNLSKTGENSIITTNSGIWKFNNYRWELIQQFNNNSSYFIEQYKDSFKIGTDEGLYIVDNQFDLQKDSTFTQKINHYVNWFSNGDEYEAYAKSDGFVRLKNPNNDNFISEYLSSVDSQEVSYIYKTLGLRNNIDSIIEYDLLLVSSNTSIYGACNGLVDDIFGDQLVSRKLIDLSASVNKINAIFSPYNIPTIPANNNLNTKLFALTNKGLYKIGNFRWCDPNISDGQLFNTETIFLNNLDCKCFEIDTDLASNQSSPGKSKIFIGTNYGVYRSLDGGNYFEPTQRFDNKIPIVYSLKLFLSKFDSNGSEVERNVLVACTDMGLWYTIDDGDNWYRCGFPTINNESPVLFKYDPSNFVEFSQTNTSSYLAQTFRAPSTASTIDKISVELKVDENLKSFPEYVTSLNNNYIQATLCQVDVNGLPDLSSILATTSTSTVYLKDLIQSNLNYFEFNYSTSSNQNIALVIQENVASGGLSLLKWKKVNEYRSNYIGYAFTKYDGSWLKLDSQNNQFNHRIFYTSNLLPTETYVPVGKNLDDETGWEHGQFKGCIEKDNGDLISDIRFLISLLIDDTYSISRIKDNFDLISKTSNFIDTIYDRTDRTIDSSLFDLSAIELWTINNQLQNLTNNIFSNESNLVVDKISNLRLTGNYTDLTNSLEISSVGLFPVSLNSTFSNYLEKIKNYLSSESSLKLSKLVTNYNNLDENDGWDFTANEIVNSKLASELMIDDFSKSYIPLLVCITDGENVSNTSISTLINNSNKFWNNQGFKNIFFNLSKNEFQDEFNDIVYQTNGLLFNLSNSNELQNSFDSLLHNGSNNIFKSKWSRKFEYDQGQYISKIYCSYTISTSEPVNSDCQIKFKYSVDGINYSDWVILTNNTDYFLNKKIKNIEYEVNMTEGWNGNSVRPSVQYLYHVEVQPSIAYLFTDLFETDGYINEYAISTNNKSDNYNIEFGLSRENSNNWNEYFNLKLDRNSLLSNRQKQYKSTDQIFTSNLTIVPIDSNFFEFEIRNNDSVFKWSSNYTSEVYLNSDLISSGNYRIDNNTGTIIFDQILENYENIRINITELPNIYVEFGESTTTINNQEYFSKVGSWKNNSNIVVLINNEITRKNYILNYEKGSVIFREKLNSSDQVTIFVHHPLQYRLCLKISSYENTLPSQINFEFVYNTLKNLNKLSELSVVTPPYLVDNRVILTSALKTDDGSLSVNYPIHLQYKFASDFGSDDFESVTSWWIQKNIYFEELGGYSNKIIQNKIDLAQNNLIFEIGDEIYVQVQPKDKFKTGISYRSENYLLTDILKPNVVDVKIKTSETIVNNLVNPNVELKSSYIFNSTALDSSIIKWYDWNSSTVIFTGANLPSDLVTSGRIISFIVTPYDGVSYGDPIESNYVLVA